MAAKTILVVEDDDITRVGFGTVLGEHGYRVGLAADGQEALDYLHSYGPPDLIILDMFTRGMDGWEFLERRRTEWTAIPVLITTALSIACDAWALSLGAVGLLRKPIDLEVLVERVGECLRADKVTRAG